MRLFQWEYGIAYIKEHLIGFNNIKIWSILADQVRIHKNTRPRKRKHVYAIAQNMFFFSLRGPQNMYYRWKLGFKFFTSFALLYIPYMDKYRRIHSTYYQVTQVFTEHGNTKQILKGLKLYKQTYVMKMTSLSCAAAIQPFTTRTFLASPTTPFVHLSFGLPLFLVPQRGSVNSILGIASSSILATPPAHCSLSSLIAITTPLPLLYIE